MSCKPVTVMPSSFATCRDPSSLERISLFIGAMTACSLVLNSFPDTIIRMVVAFVAGEHHRCRDELFPRCRQTIYNTIWLHKFLRQLVPLSRRIVPEPVQMTYIVTDLMIGWRAMGQAACIPSAIAELIRATPWASQHVRKAGIDGDERICSICATNEYGAAEIHPVRHVTLQTRLRRPYWANTETFRAFINDRIVHVEINVCRNCVRRCNMP